jgi:hypothetical protein
MYAPSLGVGQHASCRKRSECKGGVWGKAREGRIPNEESLVGLLVAWPRVIHLPKDHSEGIDIPSERAGTRSLRFLHLGEKG